MIFHVRKWVSNSLKTLVIHITSERAQFQ
jgi:hypothetical protein